MTPKYVQLVSVAMGAAVFSLWAQDGGKPSIQITQTPSADAGGPDKMASISGKATGACAECAVVIYSKGDVWYVQPWAAQPFTKISGAGQWTAPRYTWALSMPLC